MAAILEGPLDAGPSSGGRGVFSDPNGFCSENGTFKRLPGVFETPGLSRQRGLRHGVSWQHCASLLGVGVVLGLVLAPPLSSCVTWGAALMSRSLGSLIPPVETKISAGLSWRPQEISGKAPGTQ